MQPIERPGYTRQQVLDALTGRYGSINRRFRYDLLDKYEKFKKALTTVTDATVEMHYLNEIKRIGTFTILEDPDIDWLGDRIQPFCAIRMPDMNWVEWPLGILLPSSPKRKEQNLKIYRDVSAYDGTQILKTDRFDDNYYITAGTKYTDAVKAILATSGITKINIDDSSSTLQADKTFNLGNEKLAAVNQLLHEINYTQLWADEWGFYTSHVYVSPSDRAVDVTYLADAGSVLFPQAEENVDLFDIPNKWAVIQSNDAGTMTSVYTNDNANSPTSTVARGRTIMAELETVENMASQQALDAYTAKKAFEASQVYSSVPFDTAIMPFHSFNDVLYLEYPPLGIGDKFSEMSWKIHCQAGEPMSHEIRRVIRV